MLDAASLTLLKTQADLQHWVRSMCIGPDGLLYTASGRQVCAWSTASLDRLRMLDSTRGAIRALAVTRSHIITGTQNQNVSGVRRGLGTG